MVCSENDHTVYGLPIDFILSCDDVIKSQIMGCYCNSFRDFMK